MTPLFGYFRHPFGAGSRRQVLRGLLGTAVTLACGVPRGVARATSAASFCAETPEQELLKLINDYRAAHNRGKLSLGQNISAAAQHHSTDMADRNYTDHTTKGTSDGPLERMVAHGYPANTTVRGENIYVGYGIQDGVNLGSAQAAFTWWKNSPGHTANMLSDRYVVIGIALVSTPNSEYRNYWTTNFGGVTDQAAALCGTSSQPPANVRLAIVGTRQSANATDAKLAYDGDGTTAWRTTTRRPRSAWAQFDLGSTQALAEIRWQFSRLGFADKFTIQLSSDGTNWLTLATRSNAPAVGVWQVLPWTASARYVQFSFANPNRDRRLGYLSEVQLYGPAAGLRSNAEVSTTGAGKDGEAKQAAPPAITWEDESAANPGTRDTHKQRPSGKRKRR